MINLIALTLLLFFVSLNLGGGLYEWRAVYPNWKKNVSPETLVRQLQTSGQWLANNRFWPLVSPAQGLLAIVNIVLAMRCDGNAHPYWVAAACIVLAGRIITFAIFIPPMLRIFMKPGGTDKKRLQEQVTRWTGLSAWRLPLEGLGWVLALWAFHLL